MLAACGCDLDMARKGLAAAGSSSKPYEEWTGDPVALTTVRSIAVLPFADRSPSKGFNAEGFATMLAGQLTSRGRLRVVYPAEIMRLVEADKAKAWRHNTEFKRRQALGISLAEERADQLKRALSHGEESVAGLEDRRIVAKDPVHNINDAVALGRMLGVDAVLMGTVTDYDPYMRPRLALSVTLVTTGTTDSAAMEMADLTQWGTPRAKSIARGRVWYRQQNFDSRQGNIGVGAYAHGLTHHTDHDPFDAQTYVRSMNNYYDYVGSVLAASLLKAREHAVDEAEERAIKRAREMQLTREAARSRIRALVDPGQLPDADAVMAENMQDRRERTWRPDVYSRNHPQKDPMAQFMPPPGKTTPAAATGRPPAQ